MYYSYRPVNTLSSPKLSLKKQQLCDCEAPSAHSAERDFGVHNPGRTVSIDIDPHLGHTFLTLKIPLLGSYVTKHGIELISTKAKAWLKNYPPENLSGELQRREEGRVRKEAQKATVPTKATQDATVAGQSIYQGFLTPQPANTMSRPPATTTATAATTTIKLNTSLVTLHRALSQALEQASRARENTTTAATAVTDAQARNHTATKALASAEEKVTQLYGIMPQWQMSGDRVSLHAKLSEALGEAEKLRRKINDAEREVVRATREKDDAEKEVVEDDRKVDEICERVAGDLKARQKAGNEQGDSFFTRLSLNWRNGARTIEID